MLSGGSLPPLRPSGSLDKIRALTGEDPEVFAGALPTEGTPRRLTRAFTPTLSTVFDVSIQENEQRSLGSRAYSVDTFFLPADDEDFAVATPSHIYEHDESTYAAAAAEAAPVDNRPVASATDAETTVVDDEPVRHGTVRKLASSLRRHLDMRSVRKKLGSTEALSRTLRLPGRHVVEVSEVRARERREREKKEGGGGSLTLRQLFGRQKKPKRTPIPEGWLFGPPPE